MGTSFGTRASMLRRRLRILLRARHAEMIEARIDMMRVPYGGQPIAAARKQARRLGQI